MKQMKIVSVLFVILFVMALWSCAGSSSNQPATPNLAATYPAECQGSPVSYQQVMSDQAWAEIRCTCAMDGGLVATWYNTVRVDQNPATYCLGFAVVIPVPASAAALPPPVVSGAPSASVPPLPPVLPFPVPSASATAPASAPPLPSASAPQPRDPSTPLRASLQISSKEYTCDGKMAQRKGLLVTESQSQRTSTTVVQQCVGGDLVCLTSQADRQNFDKPPCGCQTGKHLQIISDTLNTWACYDKP